MGCITIFLLITASIILLTAGKIVWDSWQSGRIWRERMPRPYRDREHSENIWKQRFNSQAMKNVDDVLQMICDAFLFNPDQRYLLLPDDKISDIYRSCYPRSGLWYWFSADRMEVESLFISLQKKFNFQTSEWHNDITINEIVNSFCPPMP